MKLAKVPGTQIKRPGKTTSEMAQQAVKVVSRI
jgi:hypothetical protein